MLLAPKMMFYISHSKLNFTLNKYLRYFFRTLNCILYDYISKFITKLEFMNHRIHLTYEFPMVFTCLIFKPNFCQNGGGALLTIFYFFLFFYDAR